MSSKQKSIRDHFKPVKSTELTEKEPNVYPLFRSKVIEKKTVEKKKLKTCRPKASKVLPSLQATSPTAAAAITPKSPATTLKSIDLKSISMAAEKIKSDLTCNQAKQSLNVVIAQNTHQFFLNQKNKRQEHSIPHQTSFDQLQYQQQPHPIKCAQRLNVQEIEYRMNANCLDFDWKQDRCCKALFDQIPCLRKNNSKRAMWRDRYRPTTVNGLLGYLPDYEYLRDWLNQLKIKSPVITTVEETAKKPGSNKRKKQAKNARDQKDDQVIYNLMLLVGGHGLGKTATVYTAAKETGYSVFEINSSSRRAGRDVTDSVGEMTESHLVRFNSNANKRKVQGETIILRDTVKTKKPKTIDIAQHFKKMLSMQNSGDSAQVQDTPVKPTENLPPSPPPPPPPPENTLQAFFKKAKEKQDLIMEEIANQPKQSLLLFEEVDILFEEDKGFWAAVIDLCQKSKRPIIMTCNDESKIPFDLLNIQSTLYFEKAITRQDQSGFIQYMQLICYAEHYMIPMQEIKYLCELCEYDIRQVIDTLQFWLSQAPSSKDGEHYAYPYLFAHIMGFSQCLFARDLMQLMDTLKGSSSRTIELCIKYYYEYISDQEKQKQQEEKAMRIEDLSRVFENASFADAWIGIDDRHRHQMYDIDQYNDYQDGYHGNDVQMISKNASDLDHWELGEIMENSITVMNLAIINKSISWSNHLSAWSSHWEYMCNTRKLYSDDCLIACKQMLPNHNVNLDLTMLQYMPHIRSLSIYDRGVAGKKRNIRTRKRQRYLQLTDESRNSIKWEQQDS